MKNELETYINLNSNAPQLNEDELIVVREFRKLLNEKDFTVEQIQASINETMTNTGKKGKNLFMPIRLATTYAQHGPELAKAIYLFGKDVILERLAK
ncbi:UNVERIFIED_CONTAM: hypothetical protein O8I53_10605 [Campylobacter lari]